MELDPNDRHNELAIQMLKKNCFFLFVLWLFESCDRPSGILW